VSAAVRFGLSEFGIGLRDTKVMSKFRRISEVEAAEIANASEQSRMLVMERDFLRDLVAAKDEYIACYKTGKRPSEKLLAKLEHLTTLVITD
jgi:hypothetical protein